MSEDINRRITSDLDALERESARRVPPWEDTEAWLERAATAPPKGRARMGFFKNERTLRIAWAVGLLMVTGGVLAATTDLFFVDVDTAGKTEHQVESEIREQLSDEGVAKPKVKFRREDDGHRVRVDGRLGDQTIRVEQIEQGAEERVVMRPPAFDIEREPGMTDDELVAKIRAQMDALGLEGEVEIVGGKVRIRVEQHIEADGSETAQ